MPSVAFAEADLVASITRASLYEFLKEFWPVVVQEEMKDNWHIKYLCDELQISVERVLANEPKEYDLIVNLPPGMTKSMVVSVALPIWAWSRMPSIKTIVATHTYNPLGLDLSRKSRDLVLSEKFRLSFPDVTLRVDQATKGFFMNKQGGWRLVSTVGGVSPMGMHAHILAVDDPLDPRKARQMSEIDIREANNWMLQDLPGRKVDKEVSLTILVMQRLHQNDPTGGWLERDASVKGTRIKHIRLPADLNDNFPVRPEELKERYVDGLLDPVRLSRDVLSDHRLEGEWSYCGQYGQHPVPFGGGMFKVDKFVIDTPDMKKIVRQVRFWDKAASRMTGSFTAGVKLGLDEDGVIWVLDVVRGQWSVDERERTILQTANTDGEEVLIAQEQEPGAGGKESAQATVRRLVGFTVETILPQGNKIARAEPFATQVNEGNVRLVRGIWNRPYIAEMEHFPYSTFKDQVDASSGALPLAIKKRFTLKDWAETAF